MPQVKKESVRQRILAAALEVFAERGYAAADPMEIAWLAHSSVGNVYRYFGDKESLFLAAVPEWFVERAVHRLAAALEATDAGELLSYLEAERQRLGALLAHDEELPESSLAAGVAEALTDAALARRFRGAPPPERVWFALFRAWLDHLRWLGALLGRYPDPAELAAAVEDCRRYHRAGLGALLRDVSPSEALDLYGQKMI